ncbi:nicotinate phosphoribosyltransferase [Halocola ammonii]
MVRITGTYTDQYQLTMSQAYFLEGTAEQTGVFDYFFRKLPLDSGYAVFAGLDNLLEILEDLRFEKAELNFLKEQGFDKRFVDYLKDFRFCGNVYSSAEGDAVFPTRPVLTIEASMIEAQLIESMLLNILNFQTLVATKASRMRRAAGEGVLIDFGMRRAHSTAAYHASRAAVVGGFDATSNVKSAMDFDISPSGTMAHSFVQSFDKEIDAFRAFAKARPKDCVLLVDTYDTLKSGVPNAIKVGKEMADRGEKLKGIRLDSGDLAYLSKETRKMLDNAGLTDAKIAASNQLDEFVIKSLKDQGAKIDVFGVGTSLVTGQPDAALDGVYKLAFANGKPRIKLSENTEKITLPHRKQVYRVSNDQGVPIGADVIALESETDLHKMIHPLYPDKQVSFKNCHLEALLKPVMQDGKRVGKKKSVQEIAEFSKERISALPDEYKRFDNPHIYKIGLSEKLKSERDKLIEFHKKQNQS